jgi:type II secretion system protein H
MRNTPRRRQTGGFTLVEIMVVVIVLAVVAGAVVPNFQSAVASLRLESACRRLAGLLDYCGQAARATGQVHGLIFSGDGVHYQAVCEVPPDEDSGDEDQTPRLEPAPLPADLDRRLAEGVRLTGAEFFEEDLAKQEGGGIRILFFPDGTTEFASLRLRSTKGEERTLQLNGVSGTVTISEARPAAEEGERE